MKSLFREAACWQCVAMLLNLSLYDNCAVKDMQDHDVRNTYGMQRVYLYGVFVSNKG